MCKCANTRVIFKSVPMPFCLVYVLTGCFEFVVSCGSNACNSGKYLSEDKQLLLTLTTCVFVDIRDGCLDY